MPKDYIPSATLQESVNFDDWKEDLGREEDLVFATDASGGKHSKDPRSRVVSSSRRAPRSLKENATLSRNCTKEYRGNTKCAPTPKLLSNGGKARFSQRRHRIAWRRSGMIVAERNHNGCEHTKHESPLWQSLELQKNGSSN